MIEGTLTVKPPSGGSGNAISEFVEMSVSGTGTVMINYDPLNNGNGESPCHRICMLLCGCCN